MARGLTRAVVCIAAASALVWISAVSAAAKGPDQAVVSGPGIEQPIAVRAPGAPTIGADLAALIESSGIFDQLWCRSCGHLTATAPTRNLGPVYLIRYRVPSETGGPARWIEQRVYPFAERRPVTFVQRGQPFWGRRTAGGWYEAAPRLQGILLGIGVPRDLPTPPPTVADVRTPSGISIALFGTGIAIVVAMIVGLILLGRAWARTRSATRTHPA
jgi:hypothetical protein